MSVVTEEAVRTAAHQIWLDEGCPDGRAETHWHQAREMMEKAAAPKRKATAPKKKAAAAGEAAVAKATRAPARPRKTAS
ncbi:MAG TPA: DUF2934 domain-containing protein [Hyphomicrobiales bacterium]|nr:DUF2934 domain-containing protein [Kaistiaceae bacterium]HQF31262.1 DUF2934 domain-containing protein [Hyphomicrobiales bacterium]